MSRGRADTVATIQPSNLAGMDFGIAFSEGRLMTIPGQNFAESTETTIAEAQAHAERSRAEPIVLGRSAMADIRLEQKSPAAGFGDFS